MSQDIIEGSWNENKYTKNFNNYITVTIFNKIKNKVNSLKKGTNCKKILFTIAVIYIIKSKFSKKLNEYRLIINKGIKFLKNNGIDYQKFISGI